MAGSAVLDSTLPAIRDTAPVCVRFMIDRVQYRADSLDIARLGKRNRRIIPRSACPGTYTSMFAQVDAHGRPINPAPPGYVDPHYLTMALPGRWTNDRLDFDVVMSQGMHEEVYLCFTRTRVACRNVATILH